MFQPAFPVNIKLSGSFFRRGGRGCPNGRSCPFFRVSEDELSHLLFVANRQVRQLYTFPASIGDRCGFRSNSLIFSATASSDDPFCVFLRLPLPLSLSISLPLSRLFLTYPLVKFPTTHSFPQQSIYICLSFSHVRTFLYKNWSHPGKLRVTSVRTTPGWTQEAITGLPPG